MSQPRWDSSTTVRHDSGNRWGAFRCSEVLEFDSLRPVHNYRAEILPQQGPVPLRHTGKFEITMSGEPQILEQTTANQRVPFQTHPKLAEVPEFDTTTTLDRKSLEKDEERFWARQKRMKRSSDAPSLVEREAHFLKSMREAREERGAPVSVAQLRVEGKQEDTSDELASMRKQLSKTMERTKQQGQRVYEFYHPGTVTEIGGELMWSCCGQYAADSEGETEVRGCHKRKKYDSTAWNLISYTPTHSAVA